MWLALTVCGILASAGVGVLVWAWRVHLQRERFFQALEEREIRRRTYGPPAPVPDLVSVREAWLHREDTSEVDQPTLDPDGPFDSLKPAPRAARQRTDDPSATPQSSDQARTESVSTSAGPVH